MSNLSGNAQLYAELQDRLADAKADNNEHDAQICETAMRDMRDVSLSTDDFDQLDRAGRNPYLS